MSANFQVRLVAKNEGLEYEDSSGTYRFDLGRDGKTWLVHLPCAKVGGDSLHRFTEEDRTRILHRIEGDLKRIWWFGIWPNSYNVRFIEDDNAPNRVRAGF